MSRAGRYAAPADRRAPRGPALADTGRARGGVGRVAPRQNEPHGRRQGHSVHTAARRHGLLPAEGRAAAGNRPADVPRGAARVARAAEGRVGRQRNRRILVRSTRRRSSRAQAECIILCHAHHPWIAFAQERRDWYTEEFLAPPLWAHTFADLGIRGARPRTASPCRSRTSTRRSSPGPEWRQIRSLRHHHIGRSAVQRVGLTSRQESMADTTRWGGTGVHLRGSDAWPGTFTRMTHTARSGRHRPRTMGAD